jgi:hypothetical protein
MSTFYAQKSSTPPSALSLSILLSLDHIVALGLRFIHFLTLHGPGGHLLHLNWSLQGYDTAGLFPHFPNQKSKT